MIDFFEIYKTELLYAFLVICGVLLLRFITSLFYKWIIRDDQKRLRGMGRTSFRLVKRIVNTIWLILGIMAISSLFFLEFYARLQNNFRLILYMGLVAVITILMASSVNLWFRKKTEL